jgi:predicted NBD/HSP70 family sugar kinase
MFIVADIGGTKTRVAGSTDLITFTEPVIIETPKKYEEGIAALVDVARKIDGGGKIDTVVAGLPVLLTHDKRGIEDATNLPDWSHKAFAHDLEESLGVSVHLENDVTLVGLGEAVYGAGKDASTVVYITVSTGVNGSRIINGKPDPTNIGVSTGRQYVSMEKDLVNWENMISGRAIEMRYGKHPRELGKEWSGWEELARITAFGVHNTILHWTPDRVVLGGSMFNDVGIPVDRVAFHVNNIMTAIPNIPEIVHSSLGDLGGLWGGLALLKQLRS